MSFNLLNLLSKSRIKLKTPLEGKQKKSISGNGLCIWILLMNNNEVTLNCLLSLLQIWWHDLCILEHTIARNIFYSTQTQSDNPLEFEWFATLVHIKGQKIFLMARYLVTPSVSTNQISHCTSRLLVAQPSLLTVPYANDKTCHKR